MYTPQRRTPYKGPRTIAKYSYKSRSGARRKLDFSTPMGRVVRWPTSRTRTTVGWDPSTKIGLRAVTVDKWTAATATATSKSLLAEDITTVARQTTGNEINLRQRDMINCLGFSLRVNLNNQSDNLAVCVRMAIISPMDKNEINDTEFFRGYSDSRAVDFAPTLNASELLFSPINRDNYVVLWEKKLLLGSAKNTNVIAGGAAAIHTDRSRPNYTSFSTYVKLNRQLRYDGDSANECSDKLFLVMWYDNPQGEGTLAQTTSLSYRRFVITHWKNPGT